MYKIPHFTETEQKHVLDFIKANPFITLIGNNGTTSVATQVPVMLTEEDGVIYLRGHIMRKTDHCNAFEKNPEVLVLFTGPHCYVSASWYSERGMGGSWNYITVHARGIIELFGDKDTIQILTDLTHTYEDNQPNPELVEKMTDEYLNSHVKAIAGFKIKITDMHPIFKLSQNRDDESYKKVVAELSDKGNDDKEIAEEMIKRRPHLFK